MQIDKPVLVRSLELANFENWQPKFNQQTSLNRPSRRPTSLPGIGRTAGILILIYLKNDVPNIVFTRRQNDLAKHPGQISFPGGRLERDEKPVDAAIRETHEEIGVAIERREILGQMNSVFIPPSDFTVHPFVAWKNSPQQFVAQESEVAEIIEVPVDHLLDSKTLEWGDIDVDQQKRHVPYYRFGHHQIWGATAIMLSELLERIQTACKS